MFSPFLGIAIFSLYAAGVFAIALWVERKAKAGRNMGDSPVIYCLSLGVWLTGWSFYGQVGRAASSGVLYLTAHLGSTAAIVLWWIVLRKMVRIKQAYRITSIADFISLRYQKSYAVAALVTVIALLGIIPYLALQIKAVLVTFAVIVNTGDSPGLFWTTEHIGYAVTLFFILFTILFGVRRVVPTERHQGMVVAMAAENFLKITAVLAVGIFAVYFLSHGFSDVFRQFQATAVSRMATDMSPGAALAAWTTNLVLAMASFMIVPAMFHIMVVENFREDHIRTAMWGFPLIMLLLNIFILPIAMVGLIRGGGIDQADIFVLALPFQSGHSWLSVLVFLGGFSSAMGFLVVNAVTLSTMFTNHILLPVTASCKSLNFLKRRLLQCRWVAVAVIILASHMFERKLARYSSLASLGVISFVALLQIAPAMVGGLFWRRGNKAGALLGMSSGFILWLYTLILPSFAKEGFISSDILQQGPWGLVQLRPEHLFGLTGLDPTSHALFWTMLINVSFYVLGSLYFPQGQDECNTAEQFTGALALEKPPGRLVPGQAVVELSEKAKRIEGLFCQYFPPEQALEAVKHCLAALNIEDKARISIMELAELCSEAEKSLASSIGASTAHYAMRRAFVFSPEEERELRHGYAEIIRELRLPPSELVGKIDFYRERERLLSAQAEQLRLTVQERDQEITQRKQVEETLRKTRSMLNNILESMPSAIIGLDTRGRVTHWNRNAASMSGREADAAVGNSLETVLPWLASQMDNVDWAIEGKRIFNAGRQTVTAAGRTKILDLMIYPLVANGVEGAVLRLDDVTERARLEDLMVQTEKMMTVGGLAAGMAHEINNPLGGILQSAQVIRRRLQPGLAANSSAAEAAGCSMPAVVDYMKRRGIMDMLDGIKESAARAARIVSHMLEFSRKSESTKQPVNLTQLMDKAVELAGSDYDLKKVYDFRKITIERHYDPDLPLAFCTQTQIEQVILNILQNAAHALGGFASQEPPQITLRALREGETARIEVQDNGPGIEEEIRRRVFEPFFSTKPHGQGTGLGLSVSYFIITQAHGGTIEVESEPGRGSKFIIHLPLGLPAPAKDPKKGR